MDTWVRHLLPFTVTFLLLLLSVIPLHLPNYASIAPILPLMGVYYWAIYRPDLFPAWMAFLIGLVYDFLSGTPIGINALVLLLVQGVSAGQRKFFAGKSFLVAWWAFGLLAAGAIALSWMLSLMLTSRLMDAKAATFEYLLMMGIFPVLNAGLARMQMVFLKDV